MSARGLVFAAALAVALLGCTQAAAPVETVLTVEGMHCDGCEESITTALQALPGVQRARADFEDGEAIILHREDEAPVARLTSEVESLGYTVVSSRTEPTTS